MSNPLEYQTESDGRTVWVNASDGCCIGRFSSFGIDVHKDAWGQMSSGDQCCDCKPGKTNSKDWEHFKASMLEHHGVVVTDEHMPIHLNTPGGT